MKNVIELHSLFMNGFFYLEIKEVQVLDDTKGASGGFRYTRKN